MRRKKLAALLLLGAFGISFPAVSVPQPIPIVREYSQSQSPSYESSDSQIQNAPYHKFSDSQTQSSSGLEQASKSKAFVPIDMRAKIDFSLFGGIGKIHVRYISDNGEPVSVYYNSKGENSKGFYVGVLEKSEESRYPNAFVPPQIKVKFDNFDHPNLGDLFKFWEHKLKPSYFNFKLKYDYHGNQMDVHFDVLNKKPNGFFVTQPQTE